MELLLAVTFVLALLTLISQVGILVFLIILIGRLFSSWLARQYVSLQTLLSEYCVQFGFVVSLIATLGSLFYSEIAFFEPCKLCWFQRIFMYPQVFIFGIAVLKKTKNTLPYTLVLSSIGIIISAYHYFIQIRGLAQPGISDACSLTGVSCVTTELLEFGYITIPLMAFTAFVLIIILSILTDKNT